MLFLLVVLQDIEPRSCSQLQTSGKKTCKNPRDVTLHCFLAGHCSNKRFHPVGCFTNVSRHPSQEELCWLQVPYTVSTCIILSYIYIIYIYYICIYILFRRDAPSVTTCSSVCGHRLIPGPVQGSNCSNITRKELNEII